MATTHRSEADDIAVKAATRAAWALGDYARFATDLIWDLGAELVRACGIHAGQRVLDVAAGSGNTALRAAAAGADVVASDLTPENFAAGRAVAECDGLSVEWVEADAERLPFPDASFDVVTSSVGAMWAPDHRRVADEFVRVCRPGGTIGMINFAADGLLVDFLAVFADYAPPPPPWALPPTLWGDRAHVTELLGDRVSSIDLVPGRYVERVAGGALGYREYYKQVFGPVVATYAALADDPDRTAALDRDFLAFAAAADNGRTGGTAEVEFQYVRITARRADRP